MNSNVGNSASGRKNSLTQSNPGKGMTNGLGGRTNGMTNGLGGRTNGLTNGLGGRTNGLTNGLGGKTNGLTNGLGGLTNGMGGYGPRTLKRNNRAMAPLRLSIILVVLMILMVPASFFIFQQNEATDLGMRADGEFSDWEGVTFFADSNSYPIAELNIVNCAVNTNEADSVFLYAQAGGNWMAAANADSLLAFIDSDDDAATGYAVNGMGADFVADIRGWNGAVQGKLLGVFSGQDQLNWSAWTWRGIEAGISGTEMEIGIPASMMQLEDAHKIQFMTMRGSSVAEVCGAAIGLGKGALTVNQIPGDLNGLVTSDALMTIQLTASGTAVEVTSIDFTYSGIGAPSVAGIPATVTPGTPVTVTVTAPISGLANGTFVRLEAANVVSTGTSKVTGTALAAYAHTAPATVLVDGAFADWIGIPKTSDADTMANPNIDIDSHAAVNSTAKAFFYLKNDGAGQMFGGSSVPQERSIPGPAGEPGEPGEPGQAAVIPRLTGEDITRIYIDTESAGLLVHGIYADYMAEIKGIDGGITTAKLYSLPGYAFVADITAANGAGELEVGMNLAEIGFNSTLTYVMESTDWSGESDMTLASGTVTPITGTRAGGTFGGGDGSSSNPYLIEDALDLQAMSGNLAAYYALANNIDASATSTWNSGAGFIPVGTSATPFTGTLHGRNYTVSGLYINRPTTDDVGLIGYMNAFSGGSGTVKYLGLVNADITGDERVGSIVGYNYYGWVNNSYATGTVTGNYNVGGLAGVNQCYMAQTYADVTVQGLIYVGGLVGYNYGDLYRSCALGNVFGNSAVGGLIGINDWKIYNSYSQGDVTRITGTATTVAGFVGDNTDQISTCYSTGRVIYADATDPTDMGFAGANTGTMTGNYWDTETSLQSANAAGGAIGKTTAEMQTLTTFSGWDIALVQDHVAETWYIYQNHDYPRLSWEPKPTEIPEFDQVLLPILLLLGFVCLGGKNKQKTQKESEEPAEEEEDGTPDTEDEKDMDFSEPPKIKHTLLFSGLAVSLVGIAGFAGLRGGIVQGLMGYDSVSPGIGPQESMGLAVSLVPVVIGAAIMLYWGKKFNPAYTEIMAAKKEIEDEEPFSEDAEEPVNDDDIDVDDAEEEFPGDLPDADDDIPEDVKIDSAVPEEFTKKLEGLDEDLVSELNLEAEELEEEEIPQTEKGPEITPATLKNQLADEMRTDRCEKMLSVAVVMPEDKAKLKQLIETGITFKEFEGEVRKAIEKRKKKEAEKDVTSEEKASILEDDLVAELTELGDEIGKDGDLENEIFKELDDLENL